MVTRSPLRILGGGAVLALASPALPAQDAFDSWASYDTGTGSTARHPYAVEAADLDGDGDQDLAVANWWNLPRVGVLFNDGTGAFGEPVLYDGSPSYEIEAADLDQDGFVDLVVSDHGANGELSRISVYWNDGSGSFLRQTYPTGSGPIGIAIADFDQDGDLDVATADQSGWDGTTVSILANLGGRELAPPVAYPAAVEVFGFVSAPYRLEPADLDGDGLVDLVVGNDDQYVSVLRNTGGGVFAAPVSQSTNMGAQAGFFPALEVADLDADGDLDVVYSNHLTSALYEDPVLLSGGAVAVFRNDGAGNLGPAEPYGMQAGKPGFADMSIVDLTGDGELDIVGVWQASGGWGLAAGDGNGGFLLATDLTSGDEPMALATLDAEGDGDVDVVVVSRESLEAAVHLNPGNGDFARPGHFQAGYLTNRHVDAGDLDGDGDLDVALAWASNNGGGIDLLFNDGTGDFAPFVEYPSSQAADDIRLGDMNGDGSLDLVWSDDVLDPPYGFKTRMNNGDGTFGPETSWYMGSCGTFDMELYDLEGDGDLDVLLGEYLACFGTVGKSMIIRLNNGDGTFAPPYRVVGDTIGVSSITAGDFDEDGLLDVVTTTAGQLNIFPGLGNGEFEPYILLDLAGQTTEILSADLNGDGHLDLAIEGSDAVYDNAAVVLLGHGDFTFEPPAVYLGNYSQSTGIAAGDVDGDGDVDLIQSNVGSSTVSYFENRGDGVFLDQIRYGVGGAGTDLTVADFTADGLPDVVVLMGVVGNLPVNGSGIDLLRAKPPCAGSYRYYGAGLGGSAGVVPVHNGSGCAEPGSAISWDLVNALPGSLALYFFGFSGASLPALGGTFLIGGAPIWATFPVDASGASSVPLALPDSPLFSGLVLHTQVLVLDPGAPQGLAFSVGLETHVE